MNQSTTCPHRPPRLLETVERFDEDLHDQAQTHRPLHCILEVGRPIQADPSKPAKGEADPLMNRLEVDLREMLDRLSQEARPITPAPPEAPLR